MNYYAHTAKDPKGKPADKSLWQLLKSHLLAVAKRGGEFARPLGLESEAELAGLLHDLGKYTERFQARLCNPVAVHGIDHWAAGAVAAMESKLGSVAFAVDGHHTGLPARETSEVPGTRNLRELPRQFLRSESRKKVTGCPESLDELRVRLEQDGLKLPVVPARLVTDYFAEALRTRFLFSCLVDADFLDTEAHFTPGLEQRRQAPDLQAGRAWELLETFLAVKSRLATTVNATRARLLADCLAAAERPQRLFTLTAPTGSGKTLASLAFALRHIAVHNAALAPDDPRRLRRIIVVIPFTSVIEQTARVCRDVFTELGEDYVLEHHSAVVPREYLDKSDRDAEDERQWRARLAAENWSSPLVVTTNVRFFESLFAHRPSECRKLHNIGRSVILFDEVQTLPPRLVPSLLSAVHLLTQEPYGATAVFMTATQPAFDRVAAKILPPKYFWKPTEISTNPEGMASAMRRTRIILPAREETISWADLAAKLAVQRQALCVVNTTKDARALFRLLPKEGRYHLSARLCPAHRLEKLRFMREQLAAGGMVRLVSTQLIEAGVDVDFPVAFRAFGPLDSIIQTAGRCNREGGNPEACPVTVFQPQDGSPLPAGYEQVMKVTNNFLDGIDTQTLHSPEIYARYFEQLYSVSGPDKAEADKVLTFSRDLDFPAADAACRLIPDGTRSVLVKWPGGDGERLAAKLEREKHLTRNDCRLAQRQSISLYEGEFQAALARGIVFKPAPKWDFYVWNSQYDDDLGACHAEEDDCIC